MSQLPVIVNLKAYRGDTWSQEFRFKSGPDTPFDLTGATVRSQARSRKQTGATVELIVATDDPDGSVTIALPDDAVADVYDYDVQVTDADGEVTTWVRGQMSVAQDVTEALP